MLRLPRGRRWRRKSISRQCRMFIFHKNFRKNGKGQYAELRLHVTCVSEATASAVRQNDECTYTSGFGRRRRRREEGGAGRSTAAEEAAQARGSIRSFFGARGGSGFHGASGSGSGGA